ncbi:MAG: FAD:protein FMN transferase [Deltaproteobacteria bacterium]|jgi:thiamine biosynthesis lipoprotein ApbE|nr:FAD:protein FMN transferase [Deltaproteobacteria bacterium]
MFGRTDTKVEIRIPKLSGSSDPPRFSANLVASLVTKADRLLSPEGEGSDVARLNRAAAGEEIRADPLTLIAVKRALAWHGLSGGAFEPALGPVKALWDAVSASPGEPPDDGELAGALALSRSEHLEADPSASTLSWRRDGCRLDLGGIAEGLAADLALETLAARGVEHASVRIGGAVASMGANPGSCPPSPWEKGLSDPLGRPLMPSAPPTGPNGKAREWRTAAFCGYTLKSVPAQGNAGKGSEGHAARNNPGGARVHEHGSCRGCGCCGRRLTLLDPATGRPLPKGLSAAVFHPSSAADAAAAAVTVSVLGPYGAERFLRQKGAQAFPEGLCAMVFSPGPEGSLATATLMLGPGGTLRVTRSLSPVPERSESREIGGIPLLPLAALSS